MVAISSPFKVSNKPAFFNRIHKQIQQRNDRRAQQKLMKAAANRLEAHPTHITKPLRPLPEYINVGLNREASITYSSRVIPFGKR